MRIESRSGRLPSSMPKGRPWSSMRTEFEKRERNGGEVSFDVSKHRVERPHKLIKGRKQIDPPYIGEPDPPMLNFDGKEALGIFVQTSGLVFNEEGFIPQQQDPSTYIARVLIENQKGLFVVGGSPKSNELRIAVEDADGPRQEVYVLVPEPYSPRGINSVVSKKGFVAVSLGRN